MKKALAALALWAAAVSLRAAWTADDLAKDLAYYERLSARENLNANDRLYILHRLQHKYASSGLDAGALDREIARREQERGASSAEEARLTRLEWTPDAAAAGRLVLELTENVVPQAYEIHDPDVPEGPILAVDLPGAASAVAKADAERAISDGALAGWKVESAGGKTRVRLFLRGERPFRVVRGDRRVTVHLEPPASPAAVQAAAPPVEAAPAAPPPEKTPEKSLPTADSRPPAGERPLSITGRVKKPGSYPYRAAPTLGELLAQAGGLLDGSTARFAKIYRRKDLSTQVLRVNLDGPKVPLAPGDIVLVP